MNLSAPLCDDHESNSSSCCEEVDDDEPGDAQDEEGYGRGGCESASAPGDGASLGGVAFETSLQFRFFAPFLQKAESHVRRNLCFPFPVVEAYLFRKEE